MFVSISAFLVSCCSISLPFCAEPTSSKLKMDFLTEASIMGQFEHPNVIFLHGVVTKGTVSHVSNVVPLSSSFKARSSRKIM